MSNNNDKFEIKKYINSKLENDELKNKVIINLTEDDNHEPYIEITYVTEEGLTGGLIKNYAHLNKVKQIALKNSSCLEQYLGDYIIPIVYDPQTGKLNLIKIKDNSYVGNKFRTSQSEAFFVGYIYNNDISKCFSEKIDLFCELIAKIMLSQTKENFGNLIFMVKNKEIPHIKYRKIWNTGYESIDISKEQDELCEKNQETIRTEFQLIKK